MIMPISEKGSVLKGNKFAPMGSKFLPFSIDHFLEGNWCAGIQTGSPKNRIIYQVFQVP